MALTMQLFPVNRTKLYCAAGAGVLLALAAAGLFLGPYPLRLSALLAGDARQWQVFRTLRLARVLVGAVGGFALGVCGFVYQTVFRNPLASPDIIGVASGASAGAAAGILLSAGAMGITACSFAGAMAAVLCALLLAAADAQHRASTVVLAGIAVHSLAQTILMALKLSADPERQLASIEYWIMGSLNGVSAKRAGGNLLVCGACLLMLFLLHRQLILLSAEESEAKMLGVSVGSVRLAVLLIATLAVACVVSLTGLISFIGLIAPHLARLLSRENSPGTMLLSGFLGGSLLCGADILARSLCASELPVSIFTSLLGAPLLLWLVIRQRREY